MTVAKAVGIETEYGLMVWGVDVFSPFTAAQMVLNSYKSVGGPSIPMGMYYNVQTGDIQEDFDDEEYEAWDELEALEELERLVEKPKKKHKSYKKAKKDGHASAQTAQNGGQSVVLYGLGSLMLANGSRFYIDHAHPEYCTAESLSPRTVVAADKAGERIVSRCAAAVNRSGILPAGQQVLIYKNNSDYKGNSYGCHENYLLGVDLFEDLLRRRSHIIYRYLLPFLISRVVICGAGKVGYENRTPPALFQLTQRADFFETLTGIQTTYQRPLFNTRDEAHSNQNTYRRLHVILGDANLSEVSTYLKVGITQIMLHMLEAGYIKTDLTLENPVEAFRQVSRDLTFKKPLKLESGEQMTAVQLQAFYLDLAEKYLDEHDGTDEQWEVWDKWADVVEALENDDLAPLSRQLDWAIKKNVLERYLAGQQSTWEAAERWQPVIETILALGDDLTIGEAMAREAGLDWADYAKQREIYFNLRRLDLEYHDIRSDGDDAGLFYRLQNAGHVDRIVTDSDIERMIHTPPTDTRAWLRGKIVERFSRYIVGADWSYIQLQVPDRTPGQVYRLEFPNPLIGTEQEMSALWEHFRTPAQMFAYFLASNQT